MQHREIIKTHQEGIRELQDIQEENRFLLTDEKLAPLMTMEKTVFERLYPTPTQRSLRQIREPLKQSGSNVVSDEEKI